MQRCYAALLAASLALASEAGGICSVEFLRRPLLFITNIITIIDTGQISASKIGAPATTNSRASGNARYTAVRPMPMAAPNLIMVFGLQFISWFLFDGKLVG